jgi:NTP pyrophosphatase (non-canonical NTP hydrolase)
MTGSKAVMAMHEEYLRSCEKFPHFNSPHEGYAVLLEEVDELWDLVKSKNPSKERMREEAVQIGAMAIKFIISCCKEEPT